MGSRGSMTRIPIWVRVPGIIALVLAGVLAGTMLVGAWADDGGHSSGGGRGSGDETEMRDHTRRGGGHD